MSITYQPFKTNAGEQVVTSDGYDYYVNADATTRSFIVTLYQSSAEPTRADKTNYITQTGQLYGTLRSECSIIRPIIVID